MTEQLPVTLVTQNASQDPLTDDDYRGIITGLREINGWSYQRLADEAQHKSKAWWQMVEVGKRPLDEEGRNALRRLTDGELPEQPPSVTAVTEAMIHPDAAMYAVGTLPVGERFRRVLMLADGDVAIYANGDVSAKPLQAVLSASTGKGTETGMVENSERPTPIAPILGANENARSARKRSGVSVTRATEAQNERRQAIGATWQDVIEAGLQALGAVTETGEA